MKSLNKIVCIVMSLMFLFSSLCYVTPASAATDYVSVDRSVNPATITTDKEAEVTLDIKGTPPVNVIVPNDVIVIIDRSGSMTGQKMTDAISSAKQFVDMMDLTKHRVGVVDFSSDAQGLPLTTDSVQVKNYISNLNAGGATATGDSILKAMEMLESRRPEAQPVIVLMTDGDATVPTGTAYQYAKEKANLAKEEGIVFYTIALLNTTDNPDTSGPNILLKEMATTSSHHHFVLGSTGLAEIYAAIVKEIGIASAYNVVVSDIVSPEFEIVPDSYKDNIPQPVVNGNTLTWSFLELKNNTLTFTYKIRPKDLNKTGTFYTSDYNSKATYLDYAGAARTKLIPQKYLKVNFPAPTITSVQPNSGHPDGGNEITIIGSNFRNGATITIGTKQALNIQWISAIELKAVVPPGVQGTSELTVKNPDGQTAFSTYQYKAEPIITLIDPANGPLAGGNIVTITGRYFMSGIKVTIGGKPAAMNYYHGSTLMKVVVPEGETSGAKDVTLTNPDGTTVTVQQGYTYNEPVLPKLEITSITPNTGLVSGGEFVIIDGNLFTSSSKVYFGANLANMVTYYSPQRIKVAAPKATQPGPVDVKVENSDGSSAVAPAGYSYDPLPAAPAPKITVITPNTGVISGGTDVLIDGSGLSSQSKVFFGNVEGKLTTYFSGSRIKVTTPPSLTEGVVDVKVVNPDGQEATVTGGYTYTLPPKAEAPTISSISPDSGYLSGGTLVNINGTNFASGAKVYFGNNLAQFNYMVTGRIQVTSPAAVSKGPVDVRVVNPDGQEAIISQAFTYMEALPTITSISPNNGPLAGGTAVLIDGTNFDSKITVQIAGKSVPVATYYSANRIKIITPSSAVAGAVNVVLTNPSGATVTTTFTYQNPVAPSPTISSISATSGPVTGGTVQLINGSNMNSAVKVYVDGKLVPVMTYYGTYRVKITMPPATVPGPVQIYIENPDGQKSNIVTYNYL
ncbi:IPT/TIG domain-containing protein [Paenibacillus gansuensis]|uniref:IPT/TIG domain-containing protein n=1 Tax=Paenibacillus gansuensis TaxID=306542 RepID=A0ABW5PK51_9BACL